MSHQAQGFVANAPLADLTYKVIGIAMKIHTAMGPGHREAAYHNAMVFELATAGVAFDVEPYVPVTLSDGSVVKGTCPDVLVENRLIVELKAHAYEITPREQAQVISYFAALPECPVALYLNFGHERLEFRRLFPPHALRRREAGAPDRNE